ncbi:RimJ/RimL family protein N-acetyltransferase [Streptomyces sp. PanSC19]|uniref:GNAT family N-acetyltransferase n=1 Tax=Streptomyces sp. PanSC19 TaxID=1520455 RepID=UPI000F9BCF0E|nr:GNAT family N-acetyltransferase [Streptomyces sp. PanSC19]ROQ31934.1 RimJ/RimL family protein N-acetyltransferase [Streptomyces sp. PanSC19]
MKIEPVATARLVLHPLGEAEAERIVARQSGTGDRWGEGYPEDGDVRAATGFLNGLAERGDPGVFRPYGIRVDGATVGGIGFHGPPDEIGVVTVGYGLTPAARGRGYASEALRALIEVARVAGVTGVKGDADLDNVASHRVMEAAGMRCVAQDAQLRHFYLGF